MPCRDSRMHPYRETATPPDGLGKGGRGRLAPLPSSPFPRLPASTIYLTAASPLPSLALLRPLGPGTSMLYVLASPGYQLLTLWCRPSGLVHKHASLIKQADEIRPLRLISSLLVTRLCRGRSACARASLA
eukprot:1346706-Pleurochrysis_carterae.AAC.1